MLSETSIRKAYELARERFAALGVDTDGALVALKAIPLSLHCWQGDDVGGFENPGEAPGGGLALSGNYPGRARNGDELRQDLDLVYRLVPGPHRLNLHAIYLESEAAVERDAIRPEHFSAWLDWAKAQAHGLDFNPTCFAHPRAADGFTLSHPDPGVRKFWIDHCRASRRVAESFGRRLGTPAVCNLWIPDGYKDTPADRAAPRQRLLDSLDGIFADKISSEYVLDALEPKLFGLGSESYVTGSMEFYTGYAISRHKLLTLDSGHFHPTESIADKVSALLPFVEGLLLHLSRGVRWDSDHVVTSTDDLHEIGREIIRARAAERIHIGLDFFDASLNRIAAWVIGARSVQRALLAGLLEPVSQLKKHEVGFDYTARLALQEALKAMPFGAVWDLFCLQNGAPVGMDVLSRVRDYEQRALAGRTDMSLVRSQAKAPRTANSAAEPVQKRRTPR